jgi:hypothetical protein
MDKKHRITYLFGAGASIGSTRSWLSKFTSNGPKESLDFLGSAGSGLPITSDLEILRNILGVIVSNAGTTAKRHKKDFDGLKDPINLFLKQAFQSQLSPDTWGKVLKVRGNDEAYKQYKLALSLFICIAEALTLPDPRYGHLIANIVDDKGKIPDEINFLTYNYDSSLERSFEQFGFTGYHNDDYMKNLRKFAKVLTSTEQDARDSKIVKLNGTASVLYELENSSVQERDILSFNTAMVDKYQVPIMVPSYPHFLDSIHRKWHANVVLDHACNIWKNRLAHLDKYSPNLGFSWDYVHSDGIIERAKGIIELTDVLVIVGYTFPAFNLKNDISILERFKSRPERKVYVQLPSDSIHEVSSRIEFILGELGSAFKPIPVTNCSQIHIPLEYFKKKPTQDISLVMIGDEFI